MYSTCVNLAIIWDFQEDCLKEVDSFGSRPLVVSYFLLLPAWLEFYWSAYTPQSVIYFCILLTLVYNSKLYTLKLYTLNSSIPFSYNFTVLPPWEIQIFTQFVPASTQINQSIEKAQNYNECFHLKFMIINSILVFFFLSG